MKKTYTYFQLKRRVDDLVYEFDRVEFRKGVFGYKRRDQELWINWHPDFGWVAWDGESDYIGGRTWSVPQHQQSNYPPEGLWLSYKGDKSYVYDLEYVDPKK